MTTPNIYALSEAATQVQSFALGCGYSGCFLRHKLLSRLQLCGRDDLFDPKLDGEAASYE